ncbi:flavodoxin family protein [bacterium]|nr:flavodoxin family protein [bacterium]
MKNIIGIVGSGRRNSNSKRILEYTLKTLNSLGANVEMINILDLNISGCAECNECQKMGECIVEDDLTPLYEQFLNADAIIISTPVYFYSLPGQIKSMIDRFQALWARRYILKIEPKRHGIGGLISIAGSSGKKVFDGVILPVKYFFDVQGKELFEPLLFRNYDGEPENIPDDFLAKIDIWTDEFYKKTYKPDS